MTERIELPPLEERAPELPPKGPWVWSKDNLFSSPASTVLTAVAGILALGSFWGLLRFVFGEGRRWDAVTSNMRLLMVQAYPAGANPANVDANGNMVSQIHRMWISVGIIAVLLALSLAIYRIGGRTSRKQVGGVSLAVGGVIAASGILGPFSVAGRLGWLIVGGVLVGLGYWLRQGEQAKQDNIPILGLVAGVLGLIVIALWTVPVPVPQITVDPDGVPGQLGFKAIASSTAVPWTLIIVVGAAAYFLGKTLMSRFEGPVLRRIMVGSWVASVPVIVLVVLRDPIIDYSSLLTDFILPAVAFAVVGGALLLYVAGGRAGEAGRAISGLLLVAAVFSFLAISAPFIYRFSLLSLALFGLLAPTFGGNRDAAVRYAVTWVSWVAILTYLIIIIGAESSVEVPGSFLHGGLALTFIIAVTSITASFPLGVILALGRTSTMPIFRLISTGYIELIRGVPLITWLLVASVVFPVALPEGIEIESVMRAIGAITFFSAAYLAENVRGGLQSVSSGQQEAAKALGMSTVQMTIFITLPQALRAVIPALVGQVIALFKDTSLVMIISLFDFLHIARAVIPTQTNAIVDGVGVNFQGSIKETLIFAAVVYWIFTFTFSRISLRLEKKLGIGER